MISLIHFKRQNVLLGLFLIQPDGCYLMFNEELMTRLETNKHTCDNVNSFLKIQFQYPNTGYNVTASEASFTPAV